MTDLVYSLNKINGGHARLVWPIVNKADDWPKTFRMEPMRVLMFAVIDEFLIDL